MRRLINSILVIDDQKVVRHTLCLCLKNLGYSEVHEAEDGLAARKVIEEHSVDLVFCDLNMPVEDGFAVLQFLASRQFEGAVVLISGEDEELLVSTSHLARQYRLGIIGCAQKPITIDIVQKLLAKGSEHIQLCRYKPVEPLTPSELSESIDNGLLCAFFQPQINLNNQTVKGLEVLARLKTRQGQLVLPDAFIPVAEQSLELILKLTKSVVKQTFQAIARYPQQLKHLTYSINISGRVLEEEAFPQWLKDSADEYGIDPEQVICELTETAISNEPGKINSQMLRLRMMKFKLSIDDFGTGFASLEQLHSLPFHELKIDKHFVLDCLANTKSAAVVEQSIKMAKAMNMEVVAEGIETLQVEVYLRSLGCDIGQGFFFSKVLEVNELLTLLSPLKVTRNE